MIRTKEESIKEYIQYVDKHTELVRRAFNSYGNDLILKVFNNRDHVEDETEELLYHQVRALIELHDMSKYDTEELEAYAARFNPYEENTDDDETIKKNFKEAWKHHYTNNPHHPEFWSTSICGKHVQAYMPNMYFVEMLCDWIAMSMNFKSSTYDWWFNDKGGKAEKSSMLSESDIKLIDRILMENKFDFSE